MAKGGYGETIGLVRDRIGWQQARVVPALTVRRFWPITSIQSGNSLTDSDGIVYPGVDAGFGINRLRRWYFIVNAWRNTFVVVLGLSRVVAVMVVAVFGLPLVVSKAILACVAAEWLPSKASTVAYLLPLFSFLAFIVLYPFVPVLCTKIPFTERLYRVVVGETLQRINQALGYDVKSVRLTEQPGNEFTADGKIGSQQQKHLHSHDPRVKESDGSPYKAEK